MAIFIMLNNYFHDFAVALLFVCLLMMTFLYRNVAKSGNPAGVDLAHSLYRSLNRVIIWSWAFILLGGIVRTLAYREYEWMEAAGRGQIIVLMLKHLLLALLVLGGTWMQLKLRKLFRQYYDNH